MTETTTAAFWAVAFAFLIVIAVATLPIRFTALIGRGTTFDSDGDRRVRGLRGRDDRHVGL